MNRLPAAHPIVAWEAAQARLERRRWTQSALAIVLTGSALATAWQWRPSSALVPAPPAMPMIVELAPVPQAPAQPTAQPPGPQQQQAPKPKPPKPKPLPKIETPMPSEITLPDVQPPAPEQPPQEHPPAPQTTAPPGEDAPLANHAAAPRQSAQSLAATPARLSFRDLLLGHLQRYKRYPQAAQMRRLQGVPYVRFTMDRAGKVLASRLERGSGHAALDNEALALLERAQPLPALPDEIPGDSLEIVVPIEFFLAR